jgi:iron complex outermembrane receptor protein
VIKGASSTLYGGGAIAGLVNLVTKTPGEAPELSFLLNGTSALGLDASGFYSGRSGKIGGTVFASYNHGSPYDPAGIGLTAIPEFDRFTLNPRLFFYPKPGTELQLGANVVAENRTGGSMAYAKGETEAGYFERNETERISTQFQLRHRLSERAQVALKNSFSFYDRGISLPGYRFAGTQRSSFSEASVTVSGERMEWIAGLNLWTDAFAQQDGEGGQDLGFSNATVGGFVQHLWNLHERWALETGFRLDRQSEYGLFALPRVSLLYEASERLTFRLGGGMGYKTPTAFSEEAERLHFRGIAPIASGLEAERSVGGNFDINHRMDLGEELSVSTNVLLFYTQIDRPLVLAREGGAWAFGQPDGQIATKGLELNMKWSFHDLKLFVGYTHARVEQEAGGAATDFPLVARHRLNNVLMYEKHENFRIGLEAYYFSPQRLGDGTEGQAYWIAGLMGEKSFGERLSVFLNFENLLDARQTRFDTIFTGSLDSPQFRDIYAPVDGFVVNGGIKLRLL